LPWDRIQPTRFRAQVPRDSEIQLLQTHQTTRAATDPDFRYLLNDIAAFEKVRSQKAISLNLASRIAERETGDAERLERENARRTALGLEQVVSIEELDLTEQSETILLQQAAQVTAEMVAMERPARPQLLSGSEAAARPAAEAVR
jgi:carboxyl-terminal processing protease